MIAIIDYGVGNLFSLSSSFKSIGADTVVTGDPEGIRKAEKLILPGVGAFRDAAEKKWVRTMTTWPSSLHQHGSLTSVDFSSNDFRSVTYFPSNLSSLNVKDNPNIQMVVPTSVVYRINNGLFTFYYDTEQNITIE